MFSDIAKADVFAGPDSPSDKWLEQPLSHSATLADRLEQPLSHSATLPECADAALSHSVRVAEWLHQATVAECLCGRIASAA